MSRITMVDCEKRLEVISLLLHIPLLSSFPDYKDAPGNALEIQAYGGDAAYREPIKCRVVTKDGRNPFGELNSLGYKDFYERLGTIIQTIYVVQSLGTGGFRDYSISF